MNQEDEDFDKKEKLEEVVPQSINNAAEVDDELDPVALNKAFIFASWSSVALVSSIFSHLILMHLTFLAIQLARYHDHSYSSPPLLCLHRLFQGRVDCLGHRWDCLDLLFCHRGGALPSLGESCRFDADCEGNCQG